MLIVLFLINVFASITNLVLLTMLVITEIKILKKRSQFSTLAVLKYYLI